MMEPTISDVLAAVQGIGVRLDAMGGRLDGVDARLDAMGGRLDVMGGRLDGVDARLDAMGGRLDGVDRRLGKIEARLDSIEARIDKVEMGLDQVDERFGKMETRFDVFETRVEAIDDWRKAQPDLRLMLANGRLTLDKIVEIEGEIRLLRSAINDHARENVTPGEMAAVHHDLSVLQREQLENAGRLLRIEEALHLTTP